MLFLRNNDDDNDREVLFVIITGKTPYRRLEVDLYRTVF